MASAWLWVFLTAGTIMPFEWVWDTSLSVLLASTILWLTLRISESSKLFLWLTYAILWTITILTNPALAIALPFLLFWAAGRARHVTRISWRVPAFTTVLIVLCCLPWTLPNYHTFPRLIPIP